MKVYLTLFLMLFALALLPASAQRQGETFTFSLGLQNAKTGELVSFSAPVRSSTGEQFRLVINPDSACYCYVVNESPVSDDVAVLYAGALKGGEYWFSPVMELEDPAGSESLFVIMSKEEQKNLYQMVAAYSSNPGSTQKRAVMNEVFRIRGDVSKFRERPEKPMLMGGVARGDPEKSQGVEFSGSATYVKTISLEH